MRISYNWLKEYAAVKIPPEKLAQILTMSGLTVESIEKTSADCMFEIEITSNRPDWLSVIGVAREVAAITGAKLKLPVVAKHKTTGKSTAGKVEVKVEDKKLCPRYTARIITDVKVGNSPSWLQQKIDAMKLRPVNNIVDITNFCLFETGEPMHAFDLDKVSEGLIIVRLARKGEKIITIDGVERTLDDSMLVIADADKPIAVAGVMGGLNTEVNYSTKHILLEAAYFDPISVRRTARKLGISTESSYRFERKVDMENIIYASNRAAGLIAETAQGKSAEFIDIGKPSKISRTIELRYSRLNKILGVEIPKAKVKKILNTLGLKTKSDSKDKIKLRAPDFRQDLQNEIDLIEEAARVYGYDKIPLTIPVISEQPVRIPATMRIKNKVRTILVGLGLDEIITYSLTSRRIVKMAGLPDGDIVAIKNPLTSEQEIMRPSLIPGMLSAILWNINRKTKDLCFFELSSRYIKEANGSFMEKDTLCMAITGATYSNWLTAPRAVNLFDLKGPVEKLFTELGVDNVSFKTTDNNTFTPGTSAVLEINGEAAGTIGKIDRTIANNFDIKEDVYAAEIYLDVLFKHARLEKHFEELPKYPSVFRDISIIADRGTMNEKIVSAIRAAGGAILKEIKLIDRYKGNQIPDGKVSLTYRLEYQDPRKTLEEKDVLAAHSGVLRTLEQTLGAKLR